MLLLKRKSERRRGRAVRLSAALALGAGVLAGVGGAFIAGSTSAYAGQALGVAYGCTAPAPVGAVNGITADVSETPNLPATDQWGTTYSETPSMTVTIPASLINLAAGFGQMSLLVDQVSLGFDASGFTQTTQSELSTNSQTITIDATTEASGATANFTFAPLSWTTTTGTPQTDTISLDAAMSFRVLTAINIGCTATTTPVLDSVTVHAPIPEPPVVVTPQAVTVSNGQCVPINVVAGATAQNNTVDNTSVLVTHAPTVGTATVGTGPSPGNGIPLGDIQYCTDATTNPTAANSDTFQWTVAGTLPTPPATTPAASSPGTVNITINFLTCVGGSGNGPNGGALGGAGTCGLNQLILLPVTSGQIVLSQTLSLPVDVLGSSFCTGGTTPGITLNGQEQTACGVMSPLTVTNSTGLDTGWSLTGEVTDFVDPAVASNATLNNCDTKATFNNHCIPGGNLGWLPEAAVSHNIVPGDTAQVTPGTPVVAPGVQAPSLPANPQLAGILQNPVQTNPVTEVAPNPGLRTSPQLLCSTISGQAGGTFICNAALQLAVPASIADPTGNGYEATITLTLTL